MSELVRESGRAAGATEFLSVARFLDELRHVTRFRSFPLIGDPLDAAVRRIENNPAFSQSRILTRLLSALAYGRGEFRRAEIAAFDSETLTVAIALMNAHAAGTSTREEWKCAVDRAIAAQDGIGG
ncbi:MAG TPA: hypothetical protein VLB72_01235 [Burkholderiales bacterium]|nr:hypothetical protein [Burkholderiales bacterium]